MRISISKPEIVTLALGELQATSRTAHTEDIAVTAHQLAPDAFAWRRYPDQINLELVRVALVDASRPKSGSLVTGSGRGGWVLTDAGIRWLERNRDLLLVALGTTPSDGGAKVKRPELRHIERERSRLLASDAWQAWSAGAPVRPVDARAVFRVDQYTPEMTVTLKIRALVDKLGTDRDVGPFIAAMAKQVQADAPEGGPVNDIPACRSDPRRA
jgi:hypothetical protein